jgi:hypothetical protein
MLCLFWHFETCKEGGGESRFESLLLPAASQSRGKGEVVS